MHDSKPGLRRRRCGKGFLYLDEQGERLTDEEALARIESLAIPPAWENVWICPQPDGHIQATGRDERGRKQYRYHPRWSERSKQTNFGRLIDFARALPRLRRRVASDLDRTGLPREKVLALVVRLLDWTLMRVGNEEYRKANRSQGLTTLRDPNARFQGGTLRFHYRAKGGTWREVKIHDARLARTVRRCQDLPGQELFQYVDDAGKHQPLDSGDVNDYLREVTGKDFTAKDFRTWGGTVAAARFLRHVEPPTSKSAAHRQTVAAVKHAAQRLRNRPATCRKHYVHPAILDGHESGDRLPPARDDLDPDDLDPAEPLCTLDDRLCGDERIVLDYLESERNRSMRPGSDSK